ncbi:UNVERIFIED_CONTAM: hypothetical protein K2H54_029420 [Gekko kuhli]
MVYELPKLHRRLEWSLSTCPFCFLIWKYSQDPESFISPLVPIKGHTWLSPLPPSLVLSLGKKVFKFKLLALALAPEYVPKSTHSIPGSGAIPQGHEHLLGTLRAWIQHWYL